MADQLYLQRGDKRYGPFSSAQLKRLAAAGRLRPTDFVRRKGMERGVPATRLKELFPGSQAGARDADANGLATEVTPLTPANRLSPQVPAPASDSGDPPSPSDAAEASPGLGVCVIPDGLILKPIPGETDAQPWLAPALTDSASPKSVEGWRAETASAPLAAAAVALADKATRTQRPQISATEEVKKRRAVAVSGAVILSQDGTSVNYKKRCRKCGHEDATRSSMPISIGITRASFFCRKCKHLREVEIEGVT
jgi:hypothetical protein